MKIGRCCRCGKEKPWVLLRGFDTDGAPIWEYRVCAVSTSHDGTVYGIEVRDITSTAQWDGVTVVGRSLTQGTTSVTPPAKTGVSPYSNPRAVWSLDCVSINRASGAKTVLASNADYVIIEKDPTSSDVAVKQGIPLSVITATPKRFGISNDGTVCLRYPLYHQGGILFFDHWKQVATSRYRICHNWINNPSAGTWTFHDATGSVSFAGNASATTIQAQLASLTEVDSVVCTGGPLPFQAVDIEVTWTTSTGQFTQIQTSGLLEGTPLFNMSTGAVAGRTAIDLGTSSITYAEDAVLNSLLLNAGVERYEISSDSQGLFVQTPRTWIVSNYSLRDLRQGKALGCHSRVSATTHRVFSDSTGAIEATLDSTMDNNDGRFVDAGTVVAKGYDILRSSSPDVYAMAGGTELLTLDVSSGALSLDHMLPGAGSTLAGADATHVVATSGGSTFTDPERLEQTTYTPFTETAVTGGDAFFSTKTYIRSLNDFYSPIVLYKDVAEFRLLHTGGTGNILKQTAWMAYGATESDVNTELQAWYGNNTDGKPNITILFTPVPDNSITPLMWFQRSQQVHITCGVNSADVDTYNLVPRGRRFVVEIRTLESAVKRHLYKSSRSAAGVTWQRDCGYGLSGGGVTVDAEYRSGTVVCYSAYPMIEDKIPPLVTGEL